MSAIASMGIARSFREDRTTRALFIIGLSVVLFVIACVVSLVSGPTGVGMDALLTYLAGHGDKLGAQERVIIEAVRLPRTGVAILVGAALGLSGAMMQGLFRNPLADPGIVGVSSGAALAAVAAIVLGHGVLAPLQAFLGAEFLPLMAFGGALVNTLLLYAIGTRGGRTSTMALILAGVAVGAITSSFTGLMIFMADDRALRDITFWSLGSLSGATYAKLTSVAPFVIAALVSIPFIARGLDALVLGDAAAFHMGIPVQWIKRVTILVVAAACGASVAVAGAIGFVGIVVPHLLRLVMGPSHRYLLPACALCGSSLLLFADSIARSIVAPAELPIGIVTAILGAPVFLSMLLGRSGRTALDNLQ